MHLRGPRRRDPAARPDAARRAAAARPSRSAARSPGSASSRRRSATGCRTSRCSRWTILTGAGEVVTATPDGEHADLFRGFPNSYGILGYATRLRIELEPVRRTSRCATSVRTTSTSCGRASATIVAHAARTTASGSTSSTAWCSRRTRPTSPSARWADDQAPLDQRLHRPADLLPLDPAAADRPPHHPRLPLALGHRLVLVLPGLRRPEPAWCAGSGRAAAGAATSTGSSSRFEHRHFGVAGRIDRLRGRPAAERVVQDVEIPLSARPSSSTGSCARSAIEPVWLCPLRCAPDASRSAGRSYPLEPGATYVNVGFWSTVADRARRRRTATSTAPSRPGDASSAATSRSTPTRSTTRTTFWPLYGGETYARSKKTLRPGRPAAQPLRQGGETSMTLTIGQAIRPRLFGPRRCPFRFTAYDGSRRGAARRGRPPAPGQRARAALPAHRARATSGWRGPTSRATSSSTACTPATPTTLLQAARGRARAPAPAGADAAELADGARLAATQAAAAAAAGAPPHWRRLRRGAAALQGARRRGDPPPLRRVQRASTSWSSGRR